MSGAQQADGLRALPINEPSKPSRSETSNRNGESMTLIEFVARQRSSLFESLERIKTSAVHVENTLEQLGHVKSSAQLSALDHELFQMNRRIGESVTMLARSLVSIDLARENALSRAVTRLN